MNEVKPMNENKPKRTYPAHGVQIPRNAPTIVFITVCTKNRVPWLASETSHVCLVDAWKAADAWAVGRYVVMPDHVHLFAAPMQPDADLGAWVRFWKSHVSRNIKNRNNRWQKDYWDTRLRTGKSYDEKWWYVRENPVRHKLVAVADDWPHQGELAELPWW
jgi:putative transposase